MIRKYMLLAILIFVSVILVANPSFADNEAETILKDGIVKIGFAPIFDTKENTNPLYADFLKSVQEKYSYFINSLPKNCRQKFTMKAVDEKSLVILNSAGYYSVSASSLTEIVGELRSNPVISTIEVVAGVGSRNFVPDTPEYCLFTFGDNVKCLVWLNVDSPNDALGKKLGKLLGFEPGNKESIVQKLKCGTESEIPSEVQQDKKIQPRIISGVPIYEKNALCDFPGKFACVEDTDWIFWKKYFFSICYHDTSDESSRFNWRLSDESGNVNSWFVFSSITPVKFEAAPDCRSFCMQKENCVYGHSDTASAVQHNTEKTNAEKPNAEEKPNYMHLTDEKVLMFPDCGYTGTLVQTDKDINDLSDYFINNQLSSIQIPQGWTAVLYDQQDYQGTKWVLNSDIPCLGSDMNDKASSIKIMKYSTTQTAECDECVQPEAIICSNDITTYCSAGLICTEGYSQVGDALRCEVEPLGETESNQETGQAWHLCTNYADELVCSEEPCEKEEKGAFDSESSCRGSMLTYIDFTIYSNEAALASSSDTGQSYLCRSSMDDYYCSQEQCEYEMIDVFDAQNSCENAKNEASTDEVDIVDVFSSFLYGVFS